MSDAAMPDERWLPVVGREGLYEVSDQGQVRSLDRVLPHSRFPDRTQQLNGRVLSAKTDRDGYRLVSLGRENTRRVHHLVLEAFVGPRPPGALTRHLNDDPSDNRVGNLAWGTPQENSDDRVRHGRSGRIERCQRGHLMAEPNLRPGLLSKGMRGCRACWLGNEACGRARRRHGRTLDLGQEADRAYDRLMRQSAVHAQPAPGAA